MAAAAGLIQLNQRSTYRIAIVNADRCKPKNCGQPCRKVCPVNQQGKQCINVNANSIVAKISEVTCTGCGICPKNPPEWRGIFENFRGSELQNYFRKIADGKLTVVAKPQYVDQIPQALTGTVKERFDASTDNSQRIQEIVETFDLLHLMDRDVRCLSGGELQRFAIAVTCVKQADVYMFDEPSSYLDVKQRIKAATAIRSLVTDDNYVIVVEHDLAVLDFLSDQICCFYGQASAYGVVTLPFGVREGINAFLAGFIPQENMRFREEPLIFEPATDDSSVQHNDGGFNYNYPNMRKVFGDFELTVEAGYFRTSQIVVLMGENGTGKTTFIRLLAGKINPDNQDQPRLNLTVSYKPQKLSPKNIAGTVRYLLQTTILDQFIHPHFRSEVMKPLAIDDLLDLQVAQLSGGELQRVALVLCLGKPADLYLIDEPSAYLDSEQRIHTMKIIKRFIFNSKASAFVVEHDLIMAAYLADRMIVFEGNPGISATARRQCSMAEGMNDFLRHLDITVRRDPTNMRPRINKYKSSRHMEQKIAGVFFASQPCKY
uniref:ATP-binding cassette sub-family E member 1 n=1 Tax=Plectus sambesii TaxID=2011161 RepID=A0A914W6J8_9BILA